MRRPPQFTETTTKRVAYGMTGLFLGLLALSLLEPFMAALAAVVGYAGGIWMGRLTEARETARGNGVRLGQ